MYKPRGVARIFGQARPAKTQVGQAASDSRRKVRARKKFSDHNILNLPLPRQHLQFSDESQFSDGSPPHPRRHCWPRVKNSLVKKQIGLNFI